MNCEKCGALLPAMAHFCPACGEEIRKTEAPDEIKEEIEEIKETAEEREEAPVNEAEPAAEDRENAPEKTEEAAPIEPAEVSAPSEEKEEPTEALPTAEEVPAETEASQKEETAENTADPVLGDEQEKANEERLLYYRRFLAYRGELIAAAGSGAVLTVAITALLGVVIDMLSAVVTAILNGQQNAGKGTFSVTSGQILPIVVAVGILMLWCGARGRAARLHTGALKTLRVLSIIRIVGLSFALLCFAGLEVSVGVLMAIGIPIGLPGLVTIPTALAFVLLAVLAVADVLALINEIKLLRLWRDGIYIQKGGVAKPGMKYIVFYHWLAAAVSVLTALAMLMLISSGNFVVALVENMGFHVEESVADMTAKMTPVIFGFTAIRWIIKACGKAAAAVAAEKVKRAVTAYRP